MRSPVGGPGVVVDLEAAVERPGRVRVLSHQVSEELQLAELPVLAEAGRA